MPISIQLVKTQPPYHLFELSGRWEWKEFNQLYMTKIRLELNMMTETTHAVIDLLDSDRFPRDTLVQLRRLVLNQHPNRGKVIFISMNSMAHALLQIITRMYPHISDQFFLVDSLEKVKDYLPNYIPHQRGAIS